jgi:hypothetical protein
MLQLPCFCRNLNHMDDLAKFYVYFHLTRDTQEIFYIGKGKEHRAFEKSSRNKYWHNIVNKHGHVVEFVKENITEEEALSLEVELIAKYSPKANLTKGGQGTAGFKHDPELVKWRNENNRRINKTYEGWIKKSKAQKEAQNRPEVKKKIQLNRKITLDAIKEGTKLNPWKGQKRPDEFKKRMSDIQKGGKAYWYGKISGAAKKIINLDTGVVFQSLKLAAASVGSSDFRPLSKALKEGRKFKKVRFAWHKEQ